MPTATITSKGQITVPKAIRDQLGVGPGDRIVFRTTGTGEVVIQAATVDVRALRGILKARGRRVTLRDMENAVRAGGGRK